MADSTEEIEFINLNGEVRRISGSSTKNELVSLIDAQDALIANLQAQTESLQAQLAVTNNEIASIVSGLQDASILEQTSNGLYFAVQKVEYTLAATAISTTSGYYSVDVALYVNGENISSGVYYLKIYGISGSTKIDLTNDSYFIFNANGTYSYTYSENLYDSFLVYAYDAEKSKILATTTAVFPKEPASPQGNYTIEITSSAGYTIHDSDIGNVYITTRLYRNGVDVTEKVAAYYPFYFLLYWALDGETEFRKIQNQSGTFTVARSLLDDKTTLYCEVDIPIDTIEGGVIF